MSDWEAQGQLPPLLLFHSLCSASCGKCVALPKASSPESASYSFLFQIPVPFVSLKVIQLVGCEDMTWINLAQDGDRWRAVVNAVTNLWFP
jgi:hypothetical protein